MIQNQKVVRETNKIFLEFCKLACPDYIKNVSKAQLAQISSSLLKYGKINVRRLYKTIEKRLSNPETIILNKNNIPHLENYLPKKESLGYKQKASRFIKETIGILIPVSANVSGKFYDSIIKNLIKNPKIKTISLENRLIENLEFMKFWALRGLPNCVYGTIQEIEKDYNVIKEYIARKDDKG
ncbi:MAG: hypothetical protein AABW67_05060 [Nanoarchaeota archaeon]